MSAPFVRRRARLPQAALALLLLLALTLAAWEDRRQVTVEHVRRSAELALLHRRRRQPFEEPGLDQQQLDDLIRQHAPQHRGRGAGGQGGRGDKDNTASNNDSEDE